MNRMSRFTELQLADLGLLSNGFSELLASKRALYIYKLPEEIGVPPIVCAADYDERKWDYFRAAFSLTQEETRAETRKRLQTLENFKAHFIKHYRSSLIDLWKGKKVFHFEDPANYLEINHKVALLKRSRHSITDLSNSQAF